MVGKRFNRGGYIGGSDASTVYLNFEGKTFRKWWAAKITGIRLYDLNNKHLRAGTILEGEIMRVLKIPREAQSLRFFKDGTIAGVNTDATELEAGVLHEIKTALYGYLFKWIHAKDGVSIGYRRQVQHGMYVTGVKKAKVHVLPMKEEEKTNPFLCEVTAAKIHTFDYCWKDFDMVEHDYRIRYLTYCYDERKTPTNKGLEMFKMLQVPFVN